MQRAVGLIEFIELLADMLEGSGQGLEAVVQVRLPRWHPGRSGARPRSWPPSWAAGSAWPRRWRPSPGSWRTPSAISW